jgi:hypothetical protein
VTIPLSLGSIDENAFFGCSNLADIYYAGSQDNWNNQVTIFANGNDYLLNANMHYAGTPVTPTEKCGDELEWTLENGTLTITGTGEMYDFTNKVTPWSASVGQINSVVIAEGVTSIGAAAFSGCTSLTSATIPVSVTSIGEGAFTGCNSLTVTYGGSSTMWDAIVGENTGISVSFAYTLSGEICSMGGMLNDSIDFRIYVRNVTGFDGTSGTAPTFRITRADGTELTQAENATAYATSPVSVYTVEWKPEELKNSSGGYVPAWLIRIKLFPKFISSDFRVELICNGEAQLLKGYPLNGSAEYGPFQEYSFLDYLQLMSSQSGDKYDRLSTIMYNYSTLLKEWDNVA